jgi:pimeloyl-ACP methyl ester carboxylesterase
VIASQHVPSTAGVTLAVHDLGGDGPPLLFCHPTGFHGMVWAPVAAELATVAHGWALDFRGHGDSTSPDDGDFDWNGMADDVLAVVDHLGREQMAAVGHSMGGAALVTAEKRRPGTFSAMWLFEPIVVPRGEGPVVGANPMADAARRRRPWFPSRDAAYDNFAAKPPLATLAPEALRAYVDHGLRDMPGADSVELKCSPEIEGRVFEGGATHRAFEHLPEVHCPVTVVVGGDNVGPALLAPGVAAALPDGTLERHAALTHFGPMEDPPVIADAIRAALGLG